MSNKRKKWVRIFLSFALMLTYFTGMLLRVEAGQEPVIIKISEGVKPGDLVAVYGDGLSGNVKFKFAEGGVVVNPVQLDTAGQFAYAVVPAELTPGAYTLQVSNDGGLTWSNAKHLNKADPQWLSETRAYPGLKLKLVGRNLDASEYSGTRNTQIQLIPDSGGLAMAAPVDIVTPYSVTFTVPTEISTGDYHIEVKTNSAGLGQNWVRHSEILTVVTAPTDSTALSLGVSWSRDFNWSNVITLYPSGRDDTTSIQNAIDTLYDQDGGVVYLTNGTYYVNSTIYLNKGIILKGQDKENTIIQYTGSGSTNVFMSKGEGIVQGMHGFANLKFMYQNNGANLTGNVRWMDLCEGWDTETYTAEKLFIYNTTISFPMNNEYVGNALIAGMKGNVLISENNWEGRLATYMLFHVKERVQVRNNYFKYNYGYCQAEASNSIFENNHLVGEKSGAQDLHGFFLNSDFGWVCKNTYYYNNTIENMGVGNDGESIAVDSTFCTWQLGDVFSATSNTVTYGSPFYYRQSTDQYNWGMEWQVVIVKGKGLGQVRNIVSHSGDTTSLPITITLDKNWDIVPDNTSRINIVRFTTNFVAEKNILINNDNALMLYHDNYDCVIADNTSINSNGIHVQGRCNNFDIPGTGFDDVAKYGEPSYFASIKRNILIGGDPRTPAQCYMGISAEQVFNNLADAYIVTILGTEMRGNTIDRLGCETEIDSFVQNPAGIIVSCRSYGTTGRGIVGTMVEGNKIKNSQYGMWISSGSDGTILKNNVYKLGAYGVQNVVDTGGQNILHYEDNGTPTPTPTPTPDGSGTSFITGRTLSSTLRNNFGSDLGMKITVGNSAIRVKSLGRYFAFGNSGSHVLKVIKASDSSLVASASVDMSQGSADALGFKYAALPEPVILTANTAYFVISVEQSGEDQWYDWDSVMTSTNAAIINGAVYDEGGGSYVIGGLSGAYSYVPVNFLYDLLETTPTPTPTPTPSDASVSFVTDKLLSSTVRNNYSGGLGMKVTVGNSNITVTKLGRYSIPGNNGIHTLKVLKASDYSQVASAVINMSQGTTDALGFKYATLNTSVTLLANTAYLFISNEQSGGDQWYNWDCNLISTDVATINGAVYDDLQGEFPLAGSMGTCYVPLNFKYESLPPTPTPTPEPNTSFVTGKTLSGTVRNNLTIAVGMKITIGGSDITVKELGRYFVSGNNGTHTLKLLRASDSSQVASVAINMSEGSADAQGFKYVTLGTPVTLWANTSYYIVSTEESGGDLWYDWDSILSTTSAATINGAVYDDSQGQYMIAGQAGSYCYVPLSFKY